MRGQCSVSCEIFTIHNTFEVTKAMAEAIREYIKTHEDIADMSMMRIEMTADGAKAVFFHY